MMHPFIVAISFCSIFLLFFAAVTVSAELQSQSQSQSKSLSQSLSQPSTANVTLSSPPNTYSHARGGGHHGSNAGHHRRQGGRHQVVKVGVPSQNPPSPPANQNQNSNQTTHDAPPCKGNEKNANPGKLFGYVPRNDTSDKNTLLLDEFLHAHNWVRNKYNLPPFTWGTKLADFASSYLMVRYNDCKMIHSTSDYGENLFWGKKLHWTPSDAVFYWYDENNWYDLNTFKCLPNKICGHFTQLVWRDSVRVGCALQHCKDTSLGMLIACEYDPPGNYPNENPVVQHNNQR